MFIQNRRWCRLCKYYRQIFSKNYIFEFRVHQNGYFQKSQKLLLHDHYNYFLNLVNLCEQVNKGIYNIILKHVSFINNNNLMKTAP